MIDLCLSELFLTNGALFYNDNFIIYFVWKKYFFIFGKISFLLIVLGFYRVDKTVISFKVVMTETLCINIYIYL